MHYHIHIIDQHPVKVFVSFVMIGTFIAFLPHLLLHIFGNGPDLGLITGLTDDEKIRYGLVYLSEVEGYYILSFFFLDGSDDGLNYLRTPGQPGRGLLLTVSQYF